MEKEKRIALVTGASSGIGEKVCMQLLSDGWIVYGLSRRGTVPVDAVGLSTDVTDEEAVTAAVAKMLDAEGRIDLLVTAAGYGISGPVEFTAAADARRQTDVNFIGTFLCVKAVLPAMRKQQSGTVVCVGSVAGIMSIPYQAFYSAGKAAINSLVLSLRNEVREFGIKVCAVLPGDTVTGFTDAREKSIAGAEAYPRCESAVASMEKDERNGMQPEQVAGVICRAACAAHPAPLIIAGGKYKLFNVLFRILPTRLSYAIIGMMYR